MTSPRRLATLFLPLLLLLPVAIGTSRAQTSNSDVRYQFADTTLVRDTLGLTFERLFPIADSLRITPDTLRALSVRYRWTLARLVKLADSLAAPIDSVGAIMERERFSALAGVSGANSFQYSTTYAVGQATQTWSNRVDYRVSRGLAFLDNSTNISINKNQSGATNEDRTATTELSWRRSKDLSLGANADLTRYDSFDSRGGIYNQKGGTTNIGLAIRSTQRPMTGMTTRLNFLGGFYNSSGSEDKKGLRGDLNGEARLSRGRWLSLLTSGQVAANLVRLSLPGVDDALPGPDPVGAKDVTANIRGTAGLWQSYPVGLIVNFRQTTTSIAKPGPLDTLLDVSGNAIREVTPVQSSVSGNDNLDATLRIRKDNDRGLDIIQQVGSTRQPGSGILAGEVTSDTRKTGLSGRYIVGPWRVEGNFSMSDRTNVNPNADGRGGMKADETETNSLDGTIDWPMTSRITTRLRGSVSLNSYRYRTSAGFLLPIDPRDAYSQSYEINTQYRRSEKVSTTIGLQVSDDQDIHLLSGSAASSSESRSYRASWQWSYLLMPGLTATQTNQLNASYVFRTYIRNSNTLGVEYNTTTQLNAVFSERFSVQVNHTARFRQSGNYRPLDATDPLNYFLLADEDLNYGLNARVTYAFSPALSLDFRPDYLATGRNTVSNGVLGPDRRNRTLNLAGGTNLNLDVAGRGRLTGTLSRRYRADRTTQYLSGVETIRPRSLTLSWDGSLQFTWTL